MSQHQTQRIYLGLGSNTHAKTHLRSCLRWLRHSFLHTRVSPAYRSPAFGFDGEDFINLVVAIDSAIAPKKLKDWLRRLEDAHGRDRSQPRFSDRSLDVDILLFGDKVLPQWGIPRQETFTQPYILKPLWDLAPQLRDPRTGKTVDALWGAMQGQGHAVIEPISLEE